MESEIPCFGPFVRIVGLSSKMELSATAVYRKMIFEPDWIDRAKIWSYDVYSEYLLEFQDLPKLKLFRLLLSRNPGAIIAILSVRREDFAIGIPAEGNPALLRVRQGSVTRHSPDLEDPLSFTDNIMAAWQPFIDAVVAGPIVFRVIPSLLRS